ncbi:MAG: cobyrinate a,c-diamide synthase [Methanomicrobiales archaeon]|nr:cobyrinate a,c-diamide synthase [Methanomicrobiales archaeon]
MRISRAGINRYGVSTLSSWSIPKLTVESISNLAVPTVIIGGTHSGCGKTTIARGVMGALIERGLVVQPFKIGPDFIDPTHHTAICGRQSFTLDPFMMGEQGVLRAYCTATDGADIAVIEGVMGLFDGLDGSMNASSAHVARIIRAPVVLVADVAGMAGSVHALISGYRHFDPTIKVAGVIFNRVGSARHRQLITRGLALPALGWVPRDPRLALKSRHLGLHMASETSETHGVIEVINANCDLDAIISTAKTAKAPSPCPHIPDTSCESDVKIGVARDEAFCFYYLENLAQLTRAGARLVPFSLLKDPLPQVDGIYLGGGYPELHGKALSKSPALSALRTASAEGMPVYGECGGLLSLGESLTTDEGTFPMAGLLPCVAEMTSRVQALGYTEGTVTNNSSFLPSGSLIKGHEFHYSRVDCSRDARFTIRLTRGSGIDTGNEGLIEGNTIGTYTHAWFSTDFVISFLSAARAYQRS